MVMGCMQFEQPLFSAVHVAFRRIPGGHWALEVAHWVHTPFAFTYPGTQTISQSAVYMVFGMFVLMQGSQTVSP